NDTPLSINDYHNNLFLIYPNPSNTGFVNIKSSKTGAVQAKVFDMLGKQIIDTVITNDRLPLSSLNAGIYIVKLTQNNSTTTKKLIIE
ncbi:MAG: T9SS type A sorting domain-containing protein, partial [Bacteroidota bacterium]|nr:T9SS type A sorting domain-containing protein [Bacteroidota bacterium]